MENCNGNAAPDSLKVTPLFEPCQENPETLEHFLHTDACRVWRNWPGFICKLVWQLCEAPGGGARCSGSRGIRTTSELSLAAIVGCEARREMAGCLIEARVRKCCLFTVLTCSKHFMHNNTEKKCHFVYTLAWKYAHDRLFFLLGCWCWTLVLMTSSSFTPSSERYCSRGASPPPVFVVQPC